ncbi:hypothetical protein BGZ95_008192 [Linnemannia exigua]|uniref:Uncharacterized protein n=1 Tax=Linnemannia exigua TaxID=604196 RepID=A0AAD4DEE5_9FUNG|nr:hypothetical protein BGZ95_008192 [Linnemannia exigua]
MATETVIYVSLALVLLTRIYVFISPPEFLEQHKDRRYHEYHLYRQYHIRKQIDQGHDSKDEQEDNNELGDDDLTALLQSHSRRQRSSSSATTQETSNDGGFVDPSPLTALHYPSDELVLLGMGPGARPLPLGELSSSGYSRLENLTVSTTSTFSPSTISPTTTSTNTTPTSATPVTTGASSSYSSRDGSSEKDVWRYIIGASESGAVPSYLSLDTSEIHYNGSLHRFEKDPEVLESIKALRAGQRDMAKECPVMTVVWEGGRWCCLEGRTLYILRKLDWKGQVRVRVLVDKDPTTLAVTEECWKAAGMTSDLTPLFTSLGRKASVSTTTTTSPTTATTTTTNGEDILGSKGSSQAYVSTVTADPSTTTIGLSLDDSTFGGRILLGAPEAEANVRFSLSSSSRKGSSSLSGGSSHSGNDADVEEDEEYESGLGSDDGYMEDDEGETEEDEGDDSGDERQQHPPSRHVQTRLQAMSLQHQNATTPISSCRPTLPRALQPLTAVDESENNSDLTIVSPPSPVFTPLSTIQLPSDPIRKQSFGSATLLGGDVVHHPQAVSSHHHRHHQHQQHNHHQHHERKISIPEFMLPPPLHDEQVYLIVDPSSSSVAVDAGEAAEPLREKNPPRRDSGHGDSS